MPDRELLEDGTALTLCVDKTKKERLEAVERSLAKIAKQRGLKGFFDDCAFLTEHERLVDAEMALFGKYHVNDHINFMRRLEAVETGTWDERVGAGLDLEAYEVWHPSSKKRAANPELHRTPFLFPRKRGFPWRDQADEK